MCDGIIECSHVIVLNLFFSAFWAISNQQVLLRKRTPALWVRLITSTWNWYTYVDTPHRPPKENKNKKHLGIKTGNNKSSRCLLKLEYWITYDNYRSIYTSQNPEEWLHKRTTILYAFFIINVPIYIYIYIKISVLLFFFFFIVLGFFLNKPSNCKDLQIKK